VAVVALTSLDSGFTRAASARKQPIACHSIPNGHDWMLLSAQLLPDFALLEKREDKL
jgi:hypothetical protein